MCDFYYKFDNKRNYIVSIYKLATMHVINKKITTKFGYIPNFVLFLLKLL